MRISLLLAAVLAFTATVGASAAPVGSPQTMASGLAVPWDVVATPDGRTLITERSEKRIRVVEPDGALRTAPAWSESSATKVLGLALHPGYASNRWVYVYVTYAAGSKVLRLIDDGVNLRTDRVIFDRPIGTDGNHDGGRIRFGPDGKLYVTTGDIHDPALPRDVSKLNGKILRLNDDGSAPTDNPFALRGDDGRFVWSYGHRHPQGIAWDASGRMWESEHGPSGESYAPVGEKTGNDEVNLIVPGGDYGWPQSSGAVVAPGTRAPTWVAGDAAVAPGGMAFAPDGKLYVPMLAGKHLRVFQPQGDALSDEGQLYPGTRLRAASILGCSLAFSTDKQSGATDEVRRVAIAPCERVAPPVTTPEPVAPVVPEPTPSPTGNSAAVANAAASRRVVARAGRLLKRLGLRGVASRRKLTVRVGGYGPGSLVVRVRRPRPGRDLPVALSRLTIRSTSAVSVRMATTRRARAKLRRLKTPTRLRVTATHRPNGEAARSYGRTFRVTRRGR